MQNLTSDGRITKCTKTATHYEIYVTTVSWDCTLCDKTHASNNFKLLYTTQTGVFELFCMAKKQVVKQLGAIDSGSVMQVDGSDDGDYQSDDGEEPNPDAAEEPNPDDDPAQHENDVTLGDVKKHNKMLYVYLTHTYAEYLDINAYEPDMDQIVATYLKKNTGDDDNPFWVEQYIFEPKTRQTEFVCPFAHTRHTDADAVLKYTLNGQNGCELFYTCKCDVARENYHVCERPGFKGLLPEMLETFCVAYGDDYSFIRGKGPTYVITNKAGGFMMYSASKEKEMKAKNGDIVFTGKDYNFRPWPMIEGGGIDIPFNKFFDTLKGAGANRRQFENLVFCPDAPGIPDDIKRKIMTNGDRDFNLFTGMKYSPSSAIQECRELEILPAEIDVTNAGLIEHAEEACKSLLEHLESIICQDDDKAYTYLLNWCAHLMQKPWEKPGVAIVMLSSEEGAGKNAVTEKLQAVVGLRDPFNLSVATADPDKLFGRFNITLSHKLLVILNEADVSGQYSGKIKGLVTDPDVPLEAKFVDSYIEDSFHRFIFTSNKDAAVATVSGSRRYKMYRVSDKYTGPANADSEPYFKAIRDVPDAAFALLLLTRDIRAFNPRAFVKGDADFEAVRANFNATETMIDGMMRQGYVLEQFNGSSLIRRWMFGGVPIPKTHFTDILGGFDWSVFWKAIGGKTGDIATEVRTKKKKARTLCVQFESLLDAREAWAEKYYGELPEGWDEDEEEGVSRTVTPIFA